MTWTFSNLVDSLVAEIQRPDKRDLIESSLNAAIRELHMRPVNRGGIAAPVKYAENMVEVVFPLVAPEPFLWTIPNSSTFMQLEAIKIAGTHVFLSERRPMHMGDLALDFRAVARFYRTGNRYAFDGVWAGQELLISYYTYLPRLFWLDPSVRKIEWDDTTQKFIRTIDMLPATDLDLLPETNWALTRHAEVLRSGAKAKVSLALGNTETGKIHYSAFESGRAGVQDSEVTL